MGTFADAFVGAADGSQIATRTGWLSNGAVTTTLEIRSEILGCLTNASNHQNCRVTDAPGVNQYIQTKWYLPTNKNGYGNVLGRYDGVMSTTTFKALALRVVSNKFEVWKYINGTTGGAVKIGTTGTHTYAVGDVTRWEITGTQATTGILIKVLVNGVQDINFTYTTDTMYDTFTHAGVFSLGSGGASPAFGIIDDWESGAISTSLELAAGGTVRATATANLGFPGRITVTLWDTEADVPVQVTNARCYILSATRDAVVASGLISTDASGVGTFVVPGGVTGTVMFGIDTSDGTITQAPQGKGWLAPVLVG